MKKPRIAVTIGDPAGIGPEVVVKALAAPEIAGLAEWVVVGDSAVMRRAEQLTGVKLAAQLRDEPVASLDGEIGRAHV